MAYSLDTTVRDSEPARRSSVLSVDEYEAREAAILNRARRDTANTSTAEARARSAASRAENDAAPPATGPAKATARRSPSSPTLRRARSVTRRLGSKHPKRLLVAELLAVGAIITVSELSDGRAPVPSR